MHETQHILKHTEKLKVTYHCSAVSLKLGLKHGQEKVTSTNHLSH